MAFNLSHFYGLRESQSHAEHLVLVFSSCTDKNAMSLHFAPVADINFSPKCRSHAKRNNKPGRRGSKESGRECEWAWKTLRNHNHCGTHANVSANALQCQVVRSKKKNLYITHIHINILYIYVCSSRRSARRG